MLYCSFFLCHTHFIRTFDDADGGRWVDFHYKNTDFALSTIGRLGLKAVMLEPTMPIAEVIDSPSPSNCCTA